MGKKLWDTILSVFGCNLGWWHHIYQDSYYNSVPNAQRVLPNKMRVCGTVRTSRGFPNSLKTEMKTMKKSHTTFWQKGEVLLLIWKDKRDG
jgi:hypothetical protein